MGLQDKVTGRVKQAAGDLTGDKDTQRKGKDEERKGEAKEEAAREQERADEKSKEVNRLERKT
jgi:uncharacterized protein YjbJ (UPF0337 family)